MTMKRLIVCRIAKFVLPDIFQTIPWQQFVKLRIVSRALMIQKTERTGFFTANMETSLVQLGCAYVLVILDFLVLIAMSALRVADIMEARASPAQIRRQITLLRTLPLVLTNSVQRGLE